MGKVWAQSHGYGSWDHHRNFRGVTYVDGKAIEKAGNILVEKGVLLDSFGYSETMGYLVGDGFVMKRRLWSDNDPWPELKIYSKERDEKKAKKDLERLASFLKLPFSEGE